MGVPRAGASGWRDDGAVVPSLTEQFAQFSRNTPADALPADVVSTIVKDVVDLAGCVLWGHETPWGRRIVEHVRTIGGPGPAGVWGSDLHVAPTDAALAVGTLGHAIDFDDYHPGAKLHPATVVLPAVLSLATQTRSTGAEVIKAAAIGFEVMIRVSLATGSVAGMLRGFHMTGICGGIGAAAGASSLLRLDPSATAHALGLATTQSAGLMAFVHGGSDSKRIHAGRAAEVGIASAYMARSGLTAPAEILEMPHGGFMSALSDSAQPDLALQGLGSVWHAAEVSFKPYSCCGSIHSTLDCVAQLIAQHGLSVSDIDVIEVEQSHAVLTQCGWEYVPSDAMHAQMSLQYCMAILLLEGEILPRQFRSERLADPEVLALAARVKVVPTDEMDGLYPATFASRVRIHSGNRVHEVFRESPLGSADNPMTEDQIEAKFRSLAVDRVGHDASDRFLAAAKGLRGANSVQPLLHPLVPDTTDPIERRLTIT